MVVEKIYEKKEFSSYKMTLDNGHSLVSTPRPS
jgi:hypothetical protein